MRSLAAALLTLAVACGGSDMTGPTRRVALGQSFELRVGETATIGGELLVVGFAGVSSDSRCPIDVICVWAGEATVELTLRRLPRPEDIVELKTPGAPQARYDGYTVEVRALLPAPRASQPTDPSSYVVTLVVERS
ncbi:MAG TPA: hypothetical protein VFM88_06820 [Vicinamibacteria bacterium]|nr:hypothetical protein [Vicinamibacteria bacterium]